MNIEITDKELQIIKKALKDLIDKDGISEAQEIYLHNQFFLLILFTNFCKISK